METKKDGSGIIYHVIGNILIRMTYHRKAAKRSDLSESFVPGTQVLVGRIKKSNVPRFEAVCHTVPLPGAQIKLNGARKDPLKPIRRCGEWVQEVKQVVLAE